MGGVTQRVEAQLESEVAAGDSQIAQLELQLSELRA
jgi:hypothetical protein